MKRQRLATVFFVLLVCSNALFSQVRQVKLTSPADMRGAYQMTKQVIDTGTGEFAPNIQQMKIFTDKYVMYAHRRSDTDSMAEFGVGRFTVENGKVYEHMFFGTAGPGDNTFELAIDKRDDGYSQVIHFPPGSNGVSALLTEDYTNAGKKTRSPLDGAWSLKKVTFVDKDGKTTTYQSDENAKEFKLFESGNFMWASWMKNKETNNVNTAYGYGTFTLDSPNQITETNASSTFASLLVGKPMTLQIKMTGNDSYEQTNSGPDGSKRTEFYERMQ